MPKPHRLAKLALAVAIFLAALPASGDTFTNKKDGSRVKGALLGTAFKDGQDHFLVRKEDGTRVFLPAADWERVREPAKEQGATDPKNTGDAEKPGERTERPAPSVRFVHVKGVLDKGWRKLRDQVLADLGDAGRRRVDWVVLEIDTPGGLVAHADDICRALEALKGTKSVAFVCGGRHRGAFSAGALVALGCERLYISESACIGAASPYFEVGSSRVFAAKITSAFSAIFRALAAKRRRPSAIAAAMVDPVTELREVTVDGKKHFVSGEEAHELATRGGQPGPWITRRGQVLTLTGKEASDLGFVDGLANSREAVLKLLGFSEPSAKTVAEAEYKSQVRALSGSARAMIQAEKARNPAFGDRSVLKQGKPELLGTAARSRVRSIDQHLIPAYEELLAISRACPSLRLNDDAIQRKLQLLRAWRETPYAKAPKGL